MNVAQGKAASAATLGNRREIVRWNSVRSDRILSAAKPPPEYAVTLHGRASPTALRKGKPVKQVASSSAFFAFPILFENAKTAAFRQMPAPWHFLNFLPEPQ